MIKTNIKLQVTPEQSKAVQEICFANNIGWRHLLKLDFLDSPYLFIDARWLFYTHNTKFYNEQEEEEIDPDLFIRTNGTCVEPTEVPAEECQFAKYGFEKHKDCVILAEVGSWLIGYVKNGTQAPKPAMWFKHDGGSSAASITVPNLTPIKKPWYETCKFPCLVWDIFADKLEIATHVVNHTLYLLSDIRDHSEVRLLTNDEIEELKQ